MPHIVFGKKIDLMELSESFNPIFEKNKILIKITNIFVDKHNQTALFPTVVIAEKHQQFLIEISTTSEKTTIRLFPGTDPEKTYGVKTSMVLLAKQIKNIFTDLEITKTNLMSYLDSENYEKISA